MRVYLFIYTLSLFLVEHQRGGVEVDLIVRLGQRGRNLEEQQSLNIYVCILHV